MKPILDGESAANWRVVASSVRGAAHLQNGLPNQDSLHWRPLPGALLIGALADGAGSARHAEEGSKAAVEAAVELAATLLPKLAKIPAQDIWAATAREILGAARQAVVTQAAALSARPADLACTLIFFAATPEWVGAAQIGDGAVVLEDAAGAFLPLTRPPEGEYLNETIFVISTDALATAQCPLRVGRFPRLAAFTDGLQMLALKFPGGTPHPGFFRPLLRFADAAPDRETGSAQLAALLESPKFTDRTDDDLTLLLARLSDEPKAEGGHLLAGTVQPHAPPMPQAP